MVKYLKIMLYEVLYKIGVQLRNPSISLHTAFLYESQNWSLEKLKEYQFFKLKELITYSYDAVLAYFFLKYNLISEPASNYKF